MRLSDTFDIIERLLTWVLVYLVVALFGGALVQYRLSIVIGISLGLAFGWLSRNCSGTQKRAIVTTCSVAASVVLLWLAHTLSGSFFSYLDVVLAVATGAFFLEVIMSFTTQAPAFLSHMQVMSIFLFLGSLVFIREFSLPVVLETGGYCIAWGILLKIKIRHICEPAYFAERKWAQALLLPSLAAAIIMMLSWIMFSIIAMPQLKKGGLLPVEEMRKWQGDKIYYDLQDQVQNKITKLIFRLPSIDEQRQGLAFLSSLLKKTLDTMQAEEARLGLESLLRVSGPGTEKKDLVTTFSLTDQYLLSKAEIAMTKLSENIIQQVKRQGITIKQAISAAFLLNKMRSAGSSGQLGDAEKKLRELVDHSAAKGSAKDSLKTLIGHLREWKISSMYRHMLLSLPQKSAMSGSEAFKTEFAQLVSAVSGAASLDDFKTIREDLGTLKSRFPGEKDLAREMGEFIALKLEMEFMRAKWLLTQKLAEAGIPPSAVQRIEEAVRAMHQELAKDTTPEVSRQRLRSETEQLQQEIAQAAESSFVAEELKVDALRNTEAIQDTAMLQLEDQQMQEAMVSEEAALPIISEKQMRFIVRSLLRLFLWIILILLLCVPLAFIVLYILTKMKSRALRALSGEPRLFIIALYANLTKVLAAFGVEHRDSIPPLAYAELIQRHYAENGNQFLRLTEKFAEAKYSRHTLGPPDASAALGHYNNFLKTVFRHGNPASLLFKYCTAIAHRTPLYIKS